MSDNVVEGFFHYSSIDHSVFEELGLKLSAFYTVGGKPPQYYVADLGWYEAKYGLTFHTEENILRYLLTMRTANALFRNLEEELVTPGYQIVVQNRRKTKDLLSTVWLLGLSPELRQTALSISVSPVSIDGSEADGNEFVPVQYKGSIPLTDELKVVNDFYSKRLPFANNIGRGPVVPKSPYRPVLTFWRKQSLNKLLANLADYAQVTNSVSGLYYEPSIGCGVVRIGLLVPFKSIPGFGAFTVPHEDLNDLAYQVDITLELYPDVYEYSFSEQLKGLQDAQD